jgi:hypothetical protein
MTTKTTLFFILAIITICSAQAAVQFTETKNITSDRIPNTNIDWEIIITAYGNVTNTTSFEYNITPPLDAFSFRLNNLYVPLRYKLTNNSVSAYVSLFDSINPNQTMRYLLSYTTNPIQADVKRIFPSIFYSDEQALIVIIAKMRSFTTDNVTDFNMTVVLGYGENVKQCEGKLLDGCPETVSVDKAIVNGDYIINFILIPGSEEVTKTVSYEVPTMVILDESNNKISLDGKIVGVKILKMASGAPFQMPVVGIILDDIACGDIISAKDQFGAEQSTTCKSKKAVIILHAISQEQEVQLYIIHKIPASSQAPLSITGIVSTGTKEFGTIGSFSIKVWMVAAIVILIILAMFFYFRG